MSVNIHEQRYPKKILVAEDCRDTQFILEYTLKNIEADIHFVGNGADCVVEALSAAGQAMPFDLILMDIQMPVLDGYEATKKLRENGYDKKIVAFTTRSTKGDIEASLAAGCNGHMSKMQKKSQLLDSIEEWLDDEHNDVAAVQELPVLPVLPDIVNTAPRYASKVLILLRDLPEQREQLVRAAQENAWDSVGHVLATLTTVSLFGYTAFSKSLERTQNTLASNNERQKQHEVKQLLRCIDGILAGRLKLQTMSESH